ncbi:MAG: hypothetical protein IKB47_02905 [Clostridia bacterium]|nr:hypothetical protein [Clostridia bacterium]
MKIKRILCAFMVALLTLSVMLAVVGCNKQETPKAPEASEAPETSETSEDSETSASPETPETPETPGACYHESVTFDTIVRPTAFSKGTKTGECDSCHEEISVVLSETVPQSAIFDENASNKHTEKVNIKTDVLGDKHFYPTADDPDGNDLFVELSFLWNETLANNNNSAGAYYLYFGMLCDSSGNTSGTRKTPYHLLLVDDIGSKMWCQYAGGFESDNNTQIIYGPSIPDGLKVTATEDDYPMIGDYGWHRIGIQLHQTSRIVSGSVKHDVIATLYVDGVKLSSYKVIYDADNSDPNLLYTAKVKNGEIVYTGDVAADRYVFPYVIGDKRSKPGTETYFSVADVFVTAGDEFVIDVEKVENPEEDVFEFADATRLDGTVHFEVLPNEMAIDPDDEEAKYAYDFVFSQDRTVSTNKYTKPAYSKFNAIATPDAVVPGLKQGFIPQGMDISEEKELIFISGYFKDYTYSDTSVILTVNVKTGKKVGEYRILNVDGSKHTSHAGGVAVTEDNVFIASEEKLFRIPLSAFEEDGLQATIKIVEEIPVPTRASFCNYSDGILWVGDFYIPNDSEYATPTWRHMTNRDGKKYGAWCVGYIITDETESGLAKDAYVDGMQYATPDIVLSIDQKFQGFTVIGDKIVLSRSYGNKVNSTLIVYDNVTKEPAHTTVTLNGKSVPVWFLDSKAEGESYVTMSMSQGLSVYDGALYVLYESGALCFHDGKEIAPTDRIFKVTLP